MAKERSNTQAVVLAILQDHGKPMSAYNVLAELRVDTPKAAPPTVYRALASLMERGLVHRLESINAFMACSHEHHGNASVMSICDDCGNVEESVEPELVKTLSGITGKSGFTSTRHIIEVHGVCASCGDGDARE